MHKLGSTYTEDRFHCLSNSPRHRSRHDGRVHEFDLGYHIIPCESDNLAEDRRCPVNNG